MGASCLSSIVVPAEFPLSSVQPSTNYHLLPIANSRNERQLKARCKKIETPKPNKKQAIANSTTYKHASEISHLDSSEQ